MASNQGFFEHRGLFHTARRIPHKTLWGLALCISLSGAACSDPPPPTKSNQTTPTKPFQPEPLAEIEKKLRPYNPGGSTREALWALNEALEHPETLDPQTRDRYRWLLAKASIDLWIRILVMESDPAPQDAASRKALSDWYGLLHAALPSGYSSGGSDDEPKTAPFIRRLRELVRPVHQRASDPTTRADADALLRILDLLDARDDDARRLRAAQRLRALPAPTTSIAAYGYALLALQSLRALDNLPPDAPTDWPLLLALSQGQFCRDALIRLPQILNPSDALTLMRQRCGLACTDVPPLGVASEDLKPLTEQTHTRCAPTTLGLPPDTKGSYLSFDNYLALHALTELAAISDSLAFAISAAPDDTSPLKPLSERLSARLSALVVPGQLPFFGPTPDLGGQPGLRLPVLHQARRALQPTPAVLIFDGKTLRVAAWPRFRIEPTPGTSKLQPIALSDADYGYPGVLVGTLPSFGLDWDATASLALLEAIQALNRLPLAVNPAAPPVADPQNPTPDPKTKPPAAPPEPQLPTVTLVIDRDAPARSLIAIGSLLRRAGIKRIQLTAWPHEPDSKHLHRPTLTAVELRIDRPDPFTTRLNVADSNTYLRNPLGKLIAKVPLMEVSVYLPDIYAAVESHVLKNPGLEGLILDFAPDMPAQTLFGLLDALRFQRSGDIMPSARRLLAADPIEDEQANTSPLMWPLFLGIDPAPPLPPPPPITPPETWGLTQPLPPPP